MENFKHVLKSDFERGTESRRESILAAAGLRGPRSICVVHFLKFKQKEQLLQTDVRLCGTEASDQ